MIRVKETRKEDITFNIEIDYYIPIKVEYHSNDISSEEILYYRIFNEDSSFVEIKVNSQSQKIYSVTLVSVNGVVDYSAINLDIDNMIYCRGNPIIDTELWNGERIIDDNNNFSITRKNDNVYILLDNAKQANHRLVMPHIELLLDQYDYIVGYIFCNIPIEKRKDLEESIAASANG